MSLRKTMNSNELRKGQSENARREAEVLAALRASGIKIGALEDLQNSAQSKIPEALSILANLFPQNNAYVSDYILSALSRCA